MNEQVPVAPSEQASGIRELGQGASNAWHYLHDQTKKEVFFGGSAGPGKTFLGCFWLVLACLKYRAIRTAIFRATAEDLRKSSLVTLFEVLEKSGLKDGQHYRYTEGKGFLFYNGSTIELDYLKYEPKDPNYSRLGGRAYTYAFVDEGDQVEERGVGVLSGRLRYRTTEICHACAAEGLAVKSKAVDCDDDGNPIQWECYNCGTWSKGLVPKLLITGNPGDYWTKYRYVMTKEGERMKLKPHQARVLVLLSDNPDKAHVASYRKQLEDGDDEYDKARLLDGDWNATRKTGREFFHRYDRAKHVRRIAYNPELALHFSLDFNTAPYITGLAAQIWFEEELKRWRCHFLKEYCLSHPFANTEALAQSMARDMKEGAFAGHKQGCFYYGDATGKNNTTQVIGAIRHNYDIVERDLRPYLHNNSDRVIRRNPSHTVVRDFGNAYFDGKIGLWITFDPGMTNTTMDMIQVKEAADGSILKVMDKDRATGVTYEKYGHCLQASYYLTVGAFPDLFQRFVRK